MKDNSKFPSNEGNTKDCVVLKLYSLFIRHEAVGSYVCHSQTQPHTDINIRISGAFKKTAKILCKELVLTL